MVSRSLSLDEWAEALRTFRRSAFRLELRGSYHEPGDAVSRFLAGDPVDPDDVPAFVAWARQVRELTAEGRRLERVRVHDDPLTPYQRWERWAARQTVAAGEVIRYMPRQRAYDIRLLPAAGPDDWWLLDDERVVVMQFDQDGRLANSRMVDDPERVEQAVAWRDLAFRYSAADVTGVAQP